jgi:hypothetical protein
MIHGKTTMILTHESVHVALEQWLQRHLANEVTVKISQWLMTQNIYGLDATVTIEFEQLPDAPRRKETPMLDDHELRMKALELALETHRSTPIATKITADAELYFQFLKKTDTSAAGGATVTVSLATAPAATATYNFGEADVRVS